MRGIYSCALAAFALTFFLLSPAAFSGQATATDPYVSSPTIDSSAPSGKLTMDAVYSVLGQPDGITYKNSGSNDGADSSGTIIIQGFTADPLFKVKVWRLKQHYNNLVDLSMVTPEGEKAFNALKEQWRWTIMDALNAGFNPDKASILGQSIQLNVDNGRLVVSGEVNNQDDLLTVQRMARIYDYDPIINTTVRQQMVELDVMFIAVSGGSGLAVGPNQRSFTIDAENERADGTADPAASEALLRRRVGEALGVREGDIRLLIRPHLATLNENSASFNSGGSIWMRVEGDDSGNTQTRTYGTTLNCTPRLTSDGLIDVDVNFLFSVPTAKSFIRDSIDFRAFSHSSRAVLARNQAIVVCGMTRQMRQSGDADRPELGGVPILNELVGGHANAAEDEELYIVVRPIIPGMTTDSAAFRDSWNSAARAAGLASLFETRTPAGEAPPALPALGDESVRVNVAPATREKPDGMFWLK